MFTLKYVLSDPGAGLLVGAVFLLFSLKVHACLQCCDYRATLLVTVVIKRRKMLMIFNQRSGYPLKHRQQ